MFQIKHGFSEHVFLQSDQNENAGKNWSYLCEAVFNFLEYVSFYYNSIQPSRELKSFAFEMRRVPESFFKIINVRLGVARKLEKVYARSI